MLFAALLGAVRLLFAGDALYHKAVMAAGDANGYESLYGDIAPLVLSADIAAVNLETPVAPATGNPSKPFVFNVGTEGPLSLARAGFDLVTFANNHACDQGPQGLAETLDTLEALSVPFTGAGRNLVEAQSPLYYSAGGMTFGFVGLTDLMNSDCNSKDSSSPHVNRLEDALVGIAEARERADAVIVLVHWGAEYTHNPSHRQQTLATELIEAGALAVVGHHPHVLQPFEWVKTSDGRVGFVAYSLGNFISNQGRKYEATGADGASRDGAFAVLDITRDGEGEAYISGAKYVPLWTENNWVKRVKGDGADIRVTAPECALEWARADGDVRAEAHYSGRLEAIEKVIGGMGFTGQF